jgi:hypothetical protein
MVQDLAGRTESTSDTSPVERREPKKEVAVDPPQKKKVRIWERDILKDIPQVAAFSQKSTKERGEDTETSMRLSIATGVIARGLRSGIISSDILTSLVDNWDDMDALRGLYQEPGSGAIAPSSVTAPGHSSSGGGDVSARRAFVASQSSVGDAMSNIARNFAAHQQELANEKAHQDSLVAMENSSNKGVRKRQRTAPTDPGVKPKSWGSEHEDDDDDMDDSEESPDKKGKGGDQKDAT